MEGKGRNKVLPHTPVESRYRIDEDFCAYGVCVQRPTTTAYTVSLYILSLGDVDASRKRRGNGQKAKLSVWYVFDARPAFEGT